MVPHRRITELSSRKGGVAVRFRIYDTVFTFINSHLAASRAAQAGSVDDMIDRRNADFTELRRVLKFPEPAAVPAGDAEYTASGVQHSGILESDYTFWIVSVFSLNILDPRHPALTKINLKGG